MLGEGAALGAAPEPRIHSRRSSAFCRCSAPSGTSRVALVFHRRVEAADRALPERCVRCTAARGPLKGCGTWRHCAVSGAGGRRGAGRGRAGLRVGPGRGAGWRGSWVAAPGSAPGWDALNAGRVRPPTLAGAELRVLSSLSSMCSPCRSQPPAACRAGLAVSGAGGFWGGGWLRVKDGAPWGSHSPPPPALSESLLFCIVEPGEIWWQWLSFLQAEHGDIPSCSAAPSDMCSPTCRQVTSQAPLTG